MAFDELCALQGVTAIDLVNAPPRVQHTQWINVSVTFVKNDDGTVRLWLQPKLSPSWPEASYHHQAMFQGGFVRIFRAQFDNDVPCRFLSFLCFDWIGQENGIQIPEDVLWQFDTACRAAGSPQDLQWTFVLQHNAAPNHPAFLTATHRFLTQAAIAPFVRRRDAAVITASTASSQQPAPGRPDGYGYSSIVFGPQAPFDSNGCWPTFATRSSRLRRSDALGICKDVVFREMGECIHLADVCVPNLVVPDPTDHTAALVKAKALPLVGAPVDPRVPNDLVPAVVKWTNDELDDVPDLCARYFTESPIEPALREAQVRMVSGYRRLRSQDLALRIDGACATRFRMNSGKTDPASDVDTMWDADERCGLRHVIQSLTLVGGAVNVDPVNSPWQKSRIRPGPGAAEPRRLHGMAMGKRPVARQASPLWVETADLPTSDGHPFFERLNRVLEDCGFDAFVEGLCSAFYAARMGRPSLRPGRYFRMLLIGYFEGLSSERGIAWRVADSLSLRSFLDLELTESAPDHSTLSRTRRLIDVETHEAVFTWVLERLSEAGLVVGKTVGIDATTLEANAAMRSIERRDTGESYEAFIRRLAEASGVETPTRAELARFDRSRKNKKTSNKEWKSPQDPDAKIAKMKDGRTHLAHKAEHGVDMDTGAIVSVTVQDASDGDTATLPETLIMAAEQVEAVQPEGAGVEEVVADKGYHSDETLVGLGEVGVRSHVSEPERGRRCWQDKKTGETPPEKRAAQKALYANRRRVRGRRGRRLQRRRGEVVERTFAHMYETGGMRRVWVRGHDNVRKRVLLQAAACNIGLLLRRQTGVGTPRSLQGRALSAIYGLIGRWRGCWERLRRVWGLKRSMLHLEAA